MGWGIIAKLWYDFQHLRHIETPSQLPRPSWFSFKKFKYQHIDNYTNCPRSLLGPGHFYFGPFGPWSLGFQSNVHFSRESHWLTAPLLHSDRLQLYIHISQRLCYGQRGATVRIRADESSRCNGALIRFYLHVYTSLHLHVCWQTPSSGRFYVLAMSNGYVAAILHNMYILIQVSTHFT